MAHEHECLIYGPESARVYAVVKSQHDAIMIERQRAKQELALVRELLRKYGATIRETGTMLRAAYPDQWVKLHPWRELSRVGFETVRWAAELDTTAFDNEAGFIPCDSPWEAWEKYGKTA